MTESESLDLELEELSGRLEALEKKLTPPKRRGPYKLKKGGRCPGLNKEQEQLLERLRGKK